MKALSLQTSRGLLLQAARSFYKRHKDLIKESHGIIHAETVHLHARKAIESLSTTTAVLSTTTYPRPLSQGQALEIEAAALLHDVDDDKYFPKDMALTSKRIESNDQKERLEHYKSLYPNAVKLMREASIPEPSHETVLFMIDAVSCSKNGNSIPIRVDDSRSSSNTENDNNNTDTENATTTVATSNSSTTTNYHLLIPRWSDRIEAVGARGVWRCYQYNQEKGRPIDLPGITPRPQTAQELWSNVVPERFEAYMATPDGKTDDPSMLGHYYDKLFHVACPPSDIVRNEYLQAKLQDSAKELVEVCLRYGKTGVVDEEYIRSFRDQ